jgi:hypothetical protein
MLLILGLVTFHLTMAPSSPPLLAFARAHGPAAGHSALDLDLSATFDTVHANLPNPQSWVGPPIPLPREGKFRQKKSELLLLAASLRPPPRPSWDEIRPDPHRVRNLKLEGPLLTGHERNLRRTSRGPSLDLEDLGVFSDSTDPLTGPFELAKERDANLCQEKFQATKADLRYLQRTLQDPCTPGEYEQLLKDALPSYTSVSIGGRVMKRLGLSKLIGRTETRSR